MGVTFIYPNSMHSLCSMMRRIVGIKWSWKSKCENATLKPFAEFPRESIAWISKLSFQQFSTYCSNIPNLTIMYTVIYHEALCVTAKYRFTGCKKKKKSLSKSVGVRRDPSRTLFAIKSKYFYVSNGLLWILDTCCLRDLLAAIWLIGRHYRFFFFF